LPPFHAIFTHVPWPEVLLGHVTESGRAISQRLKKTPGALAYVPLTHALRGDLQTALVKNRAGAPVKASGEWVTAAAKAALCAPPTNQVPR
jgi:hypothetical protein